MHGVLLVTDQVRAFSSRFLAALLASSTGLRRGAALVRPEYEARQLPTLNAIDTASVGGVVRACVCQAALLDQSGSTYWQRHPYVLALRRLARCVYKLVLLTVFGFACCLDCACPGFARIPCACGPTRQGLF